MRAVLCIQCTCKQTGVVGSFLRDEETGDTLSPVFDNLAELFPWMTRNGWIEVRQEFPRKHPTGVFAKGES